MRQKVSAGATSESLNPAVSLPPPVVHDDEIVSSEEISLSSKIVQSADIAFRNHALLYTGAPETSASTETLSLHWGEEKISVSKFNICTIGPFTRTVMIDAAKAREPQMAEAYSELEKFAEEMRRRKLRSMAQSILETHRTLRESGIKIDGDS